MSLVDWISNTATRTRSDGLSAVIDSARMLYVGSWRICCSRLPLGTNVYRRDWDVLVLLDGCRVDVMRNVASEFDFIYQIEEICSVGSTSREWLAKTFTPDWSSMIENTVYVTANPYTSDILTPSDDSNISPFNPRNWNALTLNDFDIVDEVWRDAWNDELGTVPPRKVTDRVLQQGRSFNKKKLIVHYMQPHQPFIGEWALANDVHFRDRNCWGALRKGNATREDVWKAYRENLISVLDEVQLLLSSIDADTVVLSSDHGNAFGEWEIYGHPNGFLHPVVKRVPWVVTTARDTGEYKPSMSVETDVDSSTEDRLHHLGYM